MPSKTWLPALAIVVLTGLAWVVHRDDSGVPPPPTVSTAPAAAALARAPLSGGRVAAAQAMAAPERRRQLVQNLQLADHTYCSYLASSRYPHASRPIAEQPDQVYPNAPVTESNPMRLDGGGSDPKVQIQSSQSRVYMASGEVVAFSLRAIDGDGRVLPLVITRALAQGMTFNGARPAAQAVLAFADDGKLADAVAGDGAWAAVLAPSQTALATFNGTIRTDIRFSVGGRAGALMLDVIYSPELPAAWTGQVREAVEDGSLNFYLKADVRQAGRYIVTGRVDDAGGRPFALATFNDMLGVGQQEVRLTTFGKLLRDQQPALPLTLRDVDGFLLKEDTDPDRALMPRLEGKAFVGKPHPLTAFSDAEWQSEERSRYLAEFRKDLGRARKALIDADPAAPLPPGSCPESAPNQQ